MSTPSSKAKNMTNRQRPVAVIGWMIPPIAVVIALLAPPACADKTCTPSDGNNTRPGPAFECAAGEVCYLGRCIATCSAGAELFEKCDSDDDCGGARPNCVDTFCSSCEETQTCVPTLNICQSVSAVPLPDLVPRPGAPPPDIPRPLDAGFTPDGIIRPVNDAGVVDQPVDREVTRVAVIDLGVETSYESGAPVSRPIAAIHAFNTAIGAGNGLKWRVEIDPPRVEEPFPDPVENPDGPAVIADDFCEIRQLSTVSGPGGPPQPANVGRISLVNPSDFPNSISPELVATFNGATSAYEVSPPPQANFLSFSTNDPPSPHFVFVSGAVVQNLIPTIWPQGDDFGHHVPFRLVPTDTTESALRNGYRIANPADADLTFRYDRIDTGNDGFEAVFVRITGRRTELFCEQREGPSLGGDLRVRASILDAFRQAEGPNPPPYQLYFERASRELLNPPAAEGELFLVTIRIRNSIRAPIIFD
ncbi:MAG: hypothetical protein AAFN74_02475 [Myxococcota bacterium]